MTEQPAAMTAQRGKDMSISIRKSVYFFPRHMYRVQGMVCYNITDKRKQVGGTGVQMLNERCVGRGSGRPVLEVKKTVSPV